MGRLPISRASVIRELDRRLIVEVGIPGAVLMEHAGHRVADAIARRWPDARRPLVLCGPGNNGGDGYVIARHLAVRGWAPRCRALLPPATPDAKVHHAVCERLGLLGEQPAPDLVVDAVFGTGQRAPLALPPPPPFDAPLVAVDVPTGIDADTGRRVGDFPEPDFVVTIGRLKPFLFTRPVPFELVDIGLELRGEPPEAELVDEVAIPAFAAGDDKWARGHVGVVAGSEELAGAAVLACLGALRGGAGLVTLCVPKAAWGRLGALPPEVMVRERGEYDRYDALVVGPGLGRAADDEVRALWRDAPQPCVFDADALKAIPAAPSPFPRLITPHAGEAQALLGTPREELEGDRLATAARLRAVAPAIYKGAFPIVTGEPLSVLPGGVPALGTGGSGDVLAGLCGALLARHRPRDPAAVESIALQAAFLHLRAGRAAGPVGVGAREIADAIPRIR
ncbi:MAG: NAD(P)H-hydrate epimerase [Myxococcota bacterium]